MRGPACYENHESATSSRRMSHNNPEKRTDLVLVDPGDGGGEERDEEVDEEDRDHEDDHGVQDVQRDLIL